MKKTSDTPENWHHTLPPVADRVLRFGDSIPPLLVGRILQNQVAKLSSTKYAAVQLLLPSPDSGQDSCVTNANGTSNVQDVLNLQHFALQIMILFWCVSPSGKTLVTHLHEPLGGCWCFHRSPQSHQQITLVVRPGNSRGLDSNGKDA